MQFDCVCPNISSLRRDRPSELCANHLGSKAHRSSHFTHSSEWGPYLRDLRFVITQLHAIPWPLCLGSPHGALDLDNNVSKRTSCPPANRLNWFREETTRAPQQTFRRATAKFRSGSDDAQRPPRTRYWWLFPAVRMMALKQLRKVS